MRTKINLFLCLALFTGLVFTSCEKDEDSTPENKKLYPSKITMIEDGDTSITLYLYNDNKRLIKEDDGDGYYTTYEYDSDGNLYKEKWYEDGLLYDYSTFDFNADNQLIKVTQYWADNSVMFYDSLEYDALGNVIKESNFESDGTLEEYYLHEYDENGNLINEKSYERNDLTGEFIEGEYVEAIFQYDDKNGIYKNWENTYYQTGYKELNNVTKITYKEHYVGSQPEIYDAIYSYVYNEENYPTEYTIAEDGVIDEKFLIEYQEL